jgi:hypothetical protein
MLTKLDKTKYLNKMLDAFPIDRLQVARLKHRVDTAQKIVKASRQVQRQGYEEKWLAEAADDLGVDVDEMEQVINSKGYASGQFVSNWKKIWEAAGGQSIERPSPGMESRVGGFVVSAVDVRIQCKISHEWEY